MGMSQSVFEVVVADVDKKKVKFGEDEQIKSARLSVGSHSSLFEDEAKVGSNLPHFEVLPPNEVSRSHSIRFS